MCPAHLLSERHFGDGRRMDLTRRVLLISDTDRGKKRTNADPGSAQVVHFIDLQRCVDLAGIRQNIRYLIRGHGIQSAAKGIELDQIQVVCCLDIVCCGVEAGVVHPLVHHVQRALHLMQVRYGILCQHCNVVGCDHLRQTVVYFRVNVIGTSRQDDSSVACLI